MTDTEIIDFMDKHRLSVVVCDGADDYSNPVLAQYTLRLTAVLSPSDARSGKS